jgi:hypothetical protein
MGPSSDESPDAARLPDPLPPDPPSPDPEPLPKPDPGPLGFAIPTPRPARSLRSTRITAAGVVLLLAGVFAALVFVFVLSTNHADTGKTEGQLTQGAALVFLSLAAINLVAATLVLRLRPNGRTIGLIAAAIGIVIGLASLGSSPSRGLLTLVLDGFVVWVLLTEGDAFRDGGEPGKGTQGGR